MAKGKQKITAQKDTFVKVLRYLKPYWFYLGLSLVFAAVSVALTCYFKADRLRHCFYRAGPVDYEYLQ